MDKIKLLKALKYARAAVLHPEANKFITPIITDGVVFGFPPTSKDLKSQFSDRISKIEKYEEFQVIVDELIKEIENN